MQTLNLALLAEILRVSVELVQAGGEKQDSLRTLRYMLAEAFHQAPSDESGLLEAHYRLVAAAYRAMPLVQAERVTLDYRPVPAVVGLGTMDVFLPSTHPLTVYVVKGTPVEEMVALLRHLATAIEDGQVGNLLNHIQ